MVDVLVDITSLVKVFVDVGILGPSKLILEVRVTKKSMTDPRNLPDAVKRKVECDI